MNPRIAHHPDGATLMAYAAGTLAEPLAAVVAAHAAMCPRCSLELSDLDLLGGALLTRQKGMAGDGAPRATLAPSSLGPSYHPARSSDPGERLPAPIAAAYGLSFDKIPWKRLAPGVLHHRLTLTAGTQGDLRLLKISAGRRMPDHGHGGAELTLVLEGAYGDATGEYRCGDLQDVDESVEHTPVADKTEGCICMIASERPARFRGVIGRLLQPWTGM